MKRNLIIGALAIGAIASGIGFYDSYQKAKTLEDDLSQAQKTVAAQTSQRIAAEGRVDDLRRELQSAQQYLVPDRLTAYRSAAFAFVLANREVLLKQNEKTSVLLVSAIKSADLLAPGYDGVLGNRAVCLVLHRTHENQWALLTYTVGDPFSRDDLAIITERLGQRSGWSDVTEGEVILGDLRLEMPRAEAGECIAQSFHPISAILVDLHHADLRL